MKKLCIFIVFMTNMSAAYALTKNSCDFINSELLVKSHLVTNAQEKLIQEFVPADIEILKEEKEHADLQLKNAELRQSNGDDDPELVKRIEQLQTSITEHKKKFREDLEKRRNEVFNATQTQLVNEIKIYAEKNTIDIILSDGGVIYARSPGDIQCDNKNDITDVFLLWLNNKYPADK